MEENQELAMQQATQAQAPQEKMVPQSQVNDLITAKMAHAANKARAEAEAQYQQQLEALQKQQMQHNQTVPRDMDVSAMNQHINERVNAELMSRQKQLEEDALKREMEGLSNTYHAKMDQARQAYSDFNEITADFDPTEFPKITYLVAGIENGGDVVYELSKNPAKLAEMQALVEASPKMAQAQLLRLSRSISENRNVQAQAQGQNAAAPLDRLNPSRVMGSNGKPSIRDLRNADYLRG